MKSSRSWFGIDILLVTSTVALIVIGVLFIYSSGVTSTGVVISNQYLRQILWAGLGILVTALVVYPSYGRLGEYASYIYGFFLILLVVTLVIGRVVNGARSWLPFFGFGIQPSEFEKIGVILLLGHYYSRTVGTREVLKRFIVGLVIVGVPMMLILLQPDMGTALVYVPIFLVMSFVGGAPIRHVLYVLFGGLLLVIFAILPAWQTYIATRQYVLVELLTKLHYTWYVIVALGLVLALAAAGLVTLKRRYFYWIIYVTSMVTGALSGSFFMRHVLKDYQIKRLMVFLKPSIDPQGAGWNVIQSVTAVGSGGLFGKGWLKGTQSHYRFLPQQSTDFIFSILSEEWGLIGSFAVIALFMIIVFRGLAIVQNARDDYGALIAAGVVAMVGYHAFINIGMAMGIMPITGIPLFFLSYGGSSLWTGLLGVGLLMNVHLRRYGF